MNWKNIALTFLLTVSTMLACEVKRYQDKERPLLENCYFEFDSLIIPDTVYYTDEGIRVEFKDMIIYGDSASLAYVRDRYLSWKRGEYKAATPRYIKD